MLLRAKDESSDTLGRSMAVGGDGKIVATATSAAINFWNADTFAPIKSLPLGKPDKNKDPEWPALSLDQEGKRVMHTGGGAGYDVQDVATQKSVLPKGETSEADASALSPDGLYAAIASGNDVNIWRLDSADPRQQCKLTAKIDAVTFLDGDRLAAATEDGKLSLVDRATCTVSEILTFPADSAKEVRLTYHFGLLTALTSERVQIWSDSERRIVFDATTKAWPFLETLTGNEPGLLDVTGSRIVAAGNQDKSVHVFDIASRAELLNFPIDIGDCCSPVGLAVLSGRDRLLTLWSERGASRLRSWRLFPTFDALVTEAKDGLTSCMPTERRTSLGLEPEPPSWCIEREKWPYDTDEWKAWLGYRRAGLKPPLADSDQWDAWVAAQPKTELLKP
jgi:WD40 repeat protein